MKRVCVGMLVLAGIGLYGCARRSPPVVLTNGADGAAADRLGHRSVTVVGASGPATAKANVDVHGVLVIGVSETWTKQLQQLARRGLVVVSYREDGLHLMPSCHGLGGYGFARVREKSRKVSFPEAQRSVHLPVVDANVHGLRSGRQGATELENVAGPGDRVPGQVQFEIVQRGRISSGLHRVFADQLHGDCHGATHFVRRMHVGGVVSSHKAGGLREGVACETPADVFENKGCQVLGWELAVLGDKREPREWASTGSAVSAPVSLCPKGMRYDGIMCRLGGSTCEDGEGAACFDQARGEQGRGGDGVALFSKGCLALHDESCAALGAVELGENAPEQHVELRRKTLETACESGSGVACVSLSNSLRSGAAFVEQQQLGQQQQWRALLLRGCLLGDVQGCVALANLGVTVVAEEGQVGKAEQDSVCAWRLACDGGDGQLCWSLGRALRVRPQMLLSCGVLVGGGGVLGEMDERGAMMGGCHHGSARSCGALGQLLLRSTHDKGMPEGRDYLVAGCDGENADWDACLQLGALLVQQKAEKQAQDTYQKLCDMREITGCQRGEQVALSRGDEAAALAFASSQCIAGVVKSCTKLAQAYEARGQHVQAKRWLTEACDRFGDRAACAKARKINVDQSK